MTEENHASFMWRKLYGKKIWNNQPTKLSTIINKISNITKYLPWISDKASQLARKLMLKKEVWSSDTDYWAMRIGVIWESIEETIKNADETRKMRIAKVFCRHVKKKLSHTGVRYSKTILIAYWLPKWAEEFQHELNLFLQGRRRRRAESRRITKEESKSVIKKTVEEFTEKEKKKNAQGSKSSSVSESSNQRDMRFMHFE